jgi:DNA-binding IclR family transcriptional regulator
MVEDLILRILRAKEGLLFEDQGLMAKEVAEHAGLPLAETQSLLRGMAERGLVHRSSFFWYTGAGPEPGSRSEMNRAPREV